MLLKKDEQPGVHTPWPAINQLLDPSERFKVNRESKESYLFTPKHVSKLSKLLVVLRELKLTYVIQNQPNRDLQENIQTSITISNRLLTTVQMLNQDVVEVGAGCDFFTLNTTLYPLGCEVRLEDGIGSNQRTTVSQLIINNYLSGFLFRQGSFKEGLLSIECVNEEGQLLTFGRETFITCAWPLSAALSQAQFYPPTILTKVYLLVHPIPQKRLHLFWSFNHFPLAWNWVEHLQFFSHSWERLDVIRAGNTEKTFVLAQISGTHEEMDGFIEACPDSTGAEYKDKAKEFTHFFKTQNLNFYPTIDPQISLQSNDYLWFHVLIKQGWLIAPKRKSL